MMQTHLPAEAATVLVPQHWPSCDSYKLYFGIGTKVDYAAARLCAWTERLAMESDLKPRKEISRVFGGAAMLTVLYANGEGTARNLPLALRFACEAEGAPAEIGGRLETLKALRSAGTASSDKFTFCNDITSGFMLGFCSAIEAETADQDRKVAYHQIAAHWPEADRKAFATLVAAEDAYSEAHARGEINLGGTARAAEESDAEQALRENFVTAIKSFDEKKLPERSAAAATAADQELNRVYRAAVALADAQKSNYGAVQPDGIRAAERSWLKYRDSWVEFAHLHYASVPRKSWLALLTLDRISVLKETFCEMGSDEYPCPDGGDVRLPRPLP